MRGLSKDNVQLAAGLATVLGGIIAAITFFASVVGTGGDSERM
jgi:hypothetical protein